MRGDGLLAQAGDSTGMYLIAGAVIGLVLLVILAVVARYFSLWIQCKASGAGIGLRNTQERLRQLYGDDQSFTLQNADGGGALATVTLPYHTGADLTVAAVNPGSTP